MDPRHIYAGVRKEAMRSWILAVAMLGLSAAGGVRAAQLLGGVAASNAKVLCSAVFVSGRDLAEARVQSLRLDPPGSRVRLDRAARDVSISIGGLIERRAVFAGDQGCVALPGGRDSLAFDPVSVQSRLPPPETLDWPMGDRVPEAQSTGIDPELLEAAVEAAFENPADHTAAFVVVHRGRLVAERYARGIGRETQLESWSMGKSVTATLVGILVKEGELRLDQRAPVAEWQQPGDPRAQITVAHLLRMSSGLRFSFPSIERYDGTARLSFARLLWSGMPDHIRIYAGMEDVFRFAIDAPAEHPPGSIGRYRNSDPLVLGAIVRRSVEARGDDYLSWPQRALFDRIGVRRQVLETDVHGNFILTGFDYGTGRGWARLGLLYLRDGVWQGERLLPEGFVEFVSTPAPAWSEPRYGGLFWLNRSGRAPLPEDAYWMGGDGEQRVTIVPSLALVVVRLGHVAGGNTAIASLARSLELVAAAVTGRSSSLRLTAAAARRHTPAARPDPAGAVAGR
jgi:CubicO group peptidase (beta-lactamase class C family)